MKLNLKGEAILTVEEMTRAGMYLKAAIRNIRSLADVPHLPTKWPQGRACHGEMAENQLLSVAKSLGLEMGASYPGELDVREAV